MTKAQFYGMTVSQLLKEGISVKLLQKSCHQDYLGWFDDEAKEFGVCVKGDDFFHIYVHEYCHFLQWRDDKAVWNYAGVGIALMTEWMKQKKKKGQHGRFRTQYLELDCERKALKLIKKYKLPVDTKRFCQRANASLFGYLLAEKHKKWPKYFYSEKIMSYFPTKLLEPEEYSKLRNIPKEARELMEKAYE